MPRFVTLLLPYIKGLAVDFVDGGFRHGHRAGIARKEEIHVINLAVAAGHIHAGEMATDAQVGQVFGVDADELKAKFTAFKGKFEVSFDMDVIARDPGQMEEIADLVIMYLWGQKKPMLENEGIEILDISMGGEAEDTYDETADLFYYTASLSVQLRADWETHLPLPLTISKVTQVTADGEEGIELAINKLFFQTHAVSTDRNNDFERIG